MTTRLSMVSGLQFSFLQFNYINSHILLIEYLEFSSVVECAFSGGFTPTSNCTFRSQMASVALAGPLRVNDNLQTCPTVYKSGTRVLSIIPAFFCNIWSLCLGHVMGLSHDVRILQRIVLQKATGSENFFLTRNAWCAFWTRFGNQFRLVMFKS